MDKQFELENTDKRELTVTDMMVTRQAQEVQAAMIIAKKFPRDEAVSFDKIMRSCQRKGLAEQAEYTYPRGNTKVNGPSIRLAETVARGWHNVEYGIIELEQKVGSSEMMAYCWDLETNVRVTKIFTVKHVRETKTSTTNLTNTRDIYEITANMGARRLRSCILSVIPSDVVAEAIQECRKTLTGSYDKPLSDRFRIMVTTFEKDFAVSKEQIEKYLGYDSSSVDENDFLRMQGVYRSLRDGMSTPKDFFQMKDLVVEANDPFDKKKDSEVKDAE